MSIAVVPFTGEILRILDLSEDSGVFITPGAMFFAATDKKIIRPRSFARTDSHLMRLRARESQPTWPAILSNVSSGGFAGITVSLLACRHNEQQHTGEASMGSMTVGRKLGLAFGIVVLISLIGSAISIVNFLKLNRANGWNVHSYQVLRANDDMLTSTVNMETGVRGYVAAGMTGSWSPIRQASSSSPRRSTSFAASLRTTRRSSVVSRHCATCIGRWRRSTTS